MSLNAQVSAERVHIGFFGLRNAGKSSLVNRVTGQELSVVSEVRGTTTDPVRKAMELLPLGPVVIIDTPGLDDEGTLGEERVRRAHRVLDQTDIAVLVVDAAAGLSQADRGLTQLFEERHIPYVIAMNKADLVTVPENIPENMIFVSARENGNIHALKEKIAALVRSVPPARELIADLVSPGDAVVLVTPIDSAAPKGRLILPQQQTIRSLLDAGCIPVVTRETELARTLSLLREPPALVVTDSQAFGMVSRIVPDSVRLTSFSILFARYKGDLRTAVLGAAAEGRRYCADLRGLHPPPPVRRHRHGQAAAMGQTVYRQRHSLCFYLRRRVPGKSLALCAHHPLRRVHAGRARNAVASASSSGTVYPCHQLRHCHRADSRHSRPCTAPVFRASRRVEETAAVRRGSACFSHVFIV